MKQFFKMNKIAILLFLILFVWFSAVMASKWKEQADHKKAVYEIKEQCQKETTLDKRCEYFLKYEFPKESSVFVEFSQVMFDPFSILQILAPLLIIVAATSKFHPKLKSGYFKNELMRMPYKDWFQSNLKKALSVIWILPMFVFVVFLFCYLKTGNLDLPSIPKCYDSNGIPVCEGDSFLYGAEKMVPIFPTFVFVFLLNIVLNSILYVHIAVIACRKNKNIVVSMIVGYLIYIVSNIILEVFVGGLFFGRLLEVHGISAFIGLSEYWVYENDFNIWFLVLYYLILVIFSYFIMKFLYRNKEEVIMQNEK